jgi:hypothetical protein
MQVLMKDGNGQKDALSSREAKRHTFSKETWKSGIEVLCL